MKTSHWQITLLTRLIPALTLLFIIPIGLACIIGGTISTPRVSFILTQSGGSVWVRHLHLIDMRSNLIIKIHNDAIMSTALWSPDGTRMAYNNPSGQAFVWDISSKAHYPLDPAISDTMILGWSADSSTILLHFWQDNGYYLYLVHPDGSNLRKLPIPDGLLSVDENAALSPDGRFVVFAGYNLQYSDLEIYRFDILEEKLKRLTDANKVHSIDVRLSPDGRQIVYRIVDVSDIEIVVMNPDGSNQRQLTNTAGNKELPIWSPDSSQLLFAEFIDTSWPAKTLYVMNADGTDRRRIVDYISEYGSYFWSPDGKYILYEADVLHLKSELYLIPADGGESRLLYGKDFEWVSFSSWQPQP
jgi:Tol biopolymer transport system component